MADALRFLVVDDRFEDRALAARELRRGWPDGVVAEASGLDDVRRVIGERGADVVITDYWLNGATGLDVLAVVRAVDPECPVLMVTGTGNEEVAVEAMKAGFADYILKRPASLARVVPAVMSALAARDEHRARVAAEVALDRSQAFLDALVNQAPDIVYVFDVDTRRVTFVNRRVEGLLGYAPEEIVSLTVETVTRLLSHDELSRIGRIVAELCAATGTPTVEEEFRVRDKGGNERWLRGRACVFKRAPDGRVQQLLGTALDVTEEHLANARAHLQTAALRAAADAIVLTNRAGTIQWVNPAFTTLTGYTAAEAIGQTPRILKSGAQDERYYRDLWETILAGGVWRGRLVNRRKDGTTYVEEMKIRPVAADDPVEGSSSTPTHFVAIKQDVTAQVEQEQRLRSSEERFHRALSGADLGLWDANLSDGTVYLSDRWASILGYTLDELAPIETAWQRLMHPDDRAATLAAFERHLAGETPFYEAEYRMRTRAGAWAWIHGRGQVMERDAEGRARRVTGTHRDISARKEREELLRAKDEQLRHAQRMESIGQLAGGVAHDFNNLLTAILGYAELLIGDTPETDSRHADLVEIRDAGQRAAALTGQLLAFSRRQVLSPSVVTASAIVGGVEKMLRRLIRENISLEITLAADLPPARVDVGQMEQVLVNLVVNAADAMPDGGRLRIATGRRAVDDAFIARHLGAQPGRYAEITVSDDGVGMAPEVVKQIFEPFFTTKPQGKGTGLGLSVVYGIVKQSGGFIWADSAPGRGTTFTILLPETTDAPAPQARPEPAGAPASRRARIIVIDDDERVAQLAEKVLRQQGHLVLQARSAAEADQRCAEADNRIDLVLADVVMPEASGYEVALRVARRCRGSRIVLMSGYDDALAREPGARANVDRFLPKPFEPGALAALVDEVLRPLDGRDIDAARPKE